MLLFVFKYDTPKALKQKKEFVKLRELMRKIYNEEATIDSRIQSIIVADPTKKNSSVGYKQTFCFKKYRFAAFVAVLVSSY